MGKIGIHRGAGQIAAASVTATLTVFMALLLAAPAGALPQGTLNGFIGGGGAPGQLPGGYFVQPKDATVYTGEDVDPANDKILVVEGNSGSFHTRLQRLDRHGNFELAWGRDVIAAGAPGDTGTGFELCAVASACKRGLVGAGAGELDGAAGIAVSQATGHVYVRDRENLRVQEFELDGDFVRAWGWGVDTGAEQFEICTAASTCQAGLAGAGAGQLAESSVQGGGIALHPLTDDLFVADPGNRRVLQFEADGDFVRAWGWGVDTGAAQFEVCTAASACQPALAEGTENGRFSSQRPVNLAVDPDGIVYASDSSETERVVRFDSDLAPASGSAAAALLDSLPSSELLGNGTTKGLELDPDTGNLFVLRYAGVGSDAVVREIADPGAAIDGASEPTLVETHVFPTGPLDNFVPLDELAFDPLSDNLYLLTSGLFTEVPPRFTGCVPPDTEVQVCIGLVVLAQGGPIGAAFPAPPNLEAEPIVVEGTLDANGGAARVGFMLAEDVAEPDWRVVSEDRYATGTEPVVFTVPLDLNLDSLKPNAAYRLRMVAKKQTAMEAGHEVVIEHSFTTPAIPPSIRTLPTSQRGITAAGIYGSVNPNNSPTQYWFEWGPTSAYGNRTPVPDGQAGSDFSFHTFSAQLTGLEPESTYHYRIVAQNSEGTVFGEDASFTTRQAGTQPPARAFELVTPPFKVVRAPVHQGSQDGNNANPGVPSLDGEAILWNVPFFPLSEEVGWPDEGDKRMIRRTASGWVHETMNTLRPLPGSYAWLASQDVVGSSGDLETLAWRSVSGSDLPTQGGLLPTEGPLANRFYTRRVGTGTEGFTPWLGNPSAQVKAIGVPMSIYAEADRGNDRALFNDSGTAMARWGYYAGLAEDPATAADDDPSDNGLSTANPLRGRMIYLQRADHPDLLPAARKELVNACTDGELGATLIPRIATGGTIETRPCPAERQVTSPRGAVMGGGSVLPKSLAGAGPAATSLSVDGSRLFFESPDPESGLPSNPPSACTGEEAMTDCPPQLFVRQYDDAGKATVRWISHSRSVPAGAGGFSGTAGAGGLIPNQPSAMMGAGVAFQGASRAGDVVYFQTNAPLVPSDPNGGVSGAASNESWDLYRYELPVDPEADPDAGVLSRVSGGPGGNADPNTNNSTVVDGMAPGSGGSLRFLSDDGDRAYFVTAAPIPGADATAPGGGATTPDGAADDNSARNLYLFDAEETGAERYRFVARLPFSAREQTPSTAVLDTCASFGGVLGFNLAHKGGDSLEISPSNCFRGTPDGSHVVFVSGGRLTGDDGDAAGDVYLYDAEADELVRVSAPPPGADPYVCVQVGPAIGAHCHGDLGAGPGGEFHASTYGTADTGRGWGGFRYSNIYRNADGTVSVIFESRSQLVAEDTNGDHWDVYEWRNGELSLISRAKPGHHSYYSGNGKDGRDVFIWTTDRIDPRELDDGSFDVYDARIGGGFPYTAPPEPCDVLALACEGGVRQAPPDLGWASGSSAGPGNFPAAKPKARSCRKGKVRRKGRCVRPKARAGNRKGAKHKRKAGRAGKGGSR